jgi:hypothetical protein
MSKSISRKGAKKTKQLFFASLCALASLRETVYFFTASCAVGHIIAPLTRLRGWRISAAADLLCMRPGEGRNLAAHKGGAYCLLTASDPLLRRNVLRIKFAVGSAGEESPHACHSEPRLVGAKNLCSCLLRSARLGY